MLSVVPFPNLIDEMNWYAKKYKWAIKIVYHYGLQDENKKDDTVIAIGLALMSVMNSR